MCKLPKSQAKWLVLALVFGVCVGGSINAFAHLDPEHRADQLSAQLAGDPDSPERVYLRRGVVHAQSRRFEEALADFDRALEIDPDLHHARLRKTRALLDAGCAQIAQVEAEKFLLEHPENVRAMLLNARALRALGEHRRALEDFDLALRYAAEPPPQLFLERAELVLMIDSADVDRALIGLDEGIARLGQVGVLQKRAIAIERRADRPERALERLRELKRHTASSPRLMLLEADLLDELGRAQAAKSAYRGALAWIGRLPAARRNTDAIRRLRSTVHGRLQDLETTSITRSITP